MNAADVDRPSGRRQLLLMPSRLIRDGSRLLVPLPWGLDSVARRIDHLVKDDESQYQTGSANPSVGQHPRSTL